MIADSLKNMKIKEEHKCTKIPKKVLDEMKAKGAKVEKLEGEELYSVTNITYKDKAWDVYEAWGETIDGDPRVGSGFFPLDSIIGTALCPEDALGVLVMREANSIIHYYAPLRRDDFNGNILPEIGPILRAPRMLINVHHASIALSKLLQRIQNPPYNYPTINSLRSGSYICTINQQWANAGVEIVLFKP